MKLLDFGLGEVLDTEPAGDPSYSPTLPAALARDTFYTLLVRSHQWIDERSLALHEAVAARLEAQPELLNVARANLQRWLDERRAPALVEWRDLLDRAPLPEVLALLRSPSDAAARLRQSNPFAGILSPDERQAILSRHEARRA